MKNLHWSKFIFFVVFLSILAAPAQAKVWHVPGEAIDVEIGSTLEVVDCIVTDNVAHFRGGGLLVWEYLGNSQTVIYSSTIMDNQANEGDDGWVNPGCSLTLIGSTLDSDFDETFDGPGIILIDSVVAVKSTTLGAVKALYR